MTLSSGSRLGPYEITGVLGAGGMGEVYRARDTRLGREVAVKVLPDDQSTDPAASRRFLREARAASSLNHPHIVTVHDVGEDHGAAYVVMELISGKPLDAVIPTDGLPLERALPLAIDIASALATAHRSGFVHRDVKPANIMVTDTGQVKVLDFGIAKPIAPVTAPDATATATSVTTNGIVVGSAGYMSPEQALGRPVDARSDIFAFGVLLHQMLSGRSPFLRDSAVASLAAVVHDDPPPLRRDRPGLPAAVDRLTARCLRKEPGARIQNMDDVVGILEDIREDVQHAREQEALSVSPGGSRARFGALLLGTALVGTLGGGAAVFFAGTGRTTPAEPPLRRFDIPVHVTASEIAEAQDLGPAISPDGRMIAYVEGGTLKVRDLDQVTPRGLADGNEGPIWSPDSRELAFVAGRTLRRVSVTGGTSAVVSELPSGGSFLGGTWTADGRILVSLSNSPIYETPARGGNLQPLIVPDTSTEFDFHAPVALQGGRSILAVAHPIHEPAMRVVLFRDGVKTTIMGGDAIDVRTVAYAPSGHLIYERHGGTRSLYRVAFDAATGTASGPHEHLADDATGPSVSNDGTLVYRSGLWSRRAALVSVDRSGVVQASASEEYVAIRSPSYSRDGGRLGFTSFSTLDSEIRIRDLTRGTETVIPRDDDGVSQTTLLAWSPDGSELIYVSGRTTSSAIMRVATDGGSPPRLVRRCDRPCLSVDWSADGRIISWVADGDLHWITVDAPDAPMRVATLEAEFDARLSPDGRYYAYSAVVDGRAEVFVREFPSGGSRQQVSTAGGLMPRWNKLGRELYFVRGNTLFAVTYATSPFRSGMPSQLIDGDAQRLQFFEFNQGISAFDVHPNGERMAAVRRPGASDSAISVVLNASRPSSVDE